MNLSQRVSQLHESATLAVAAKAARMKADGVDVIGFGAGEPDFDTPRPIRRAAIEAIERGETRYVHPTSGLGLAKQAVCAKFARDNGLTYRPEQVIIDTGGKMIIYLGIQAIIDPGDEVVIPRPYWVSFPEIVRLAGGEPVFPVGSPTRDYRLTPDELRASLTPRTKAIIINSPSNPSGVTYSPDEIRALAKVLEGRDVWVLSDEIYDRLLFDGQETLSFAATGAFAYDHTITINSASKTYAMTGWRIGFAAGPAPVIQAMAKLQSQTTSGAVTFNQHALVEALNGSHDDVERMRAEFEKRAHYMYARLTALPGITCPKPTGAFYCFPNVSAAFARLGVRGSADFAERLLEQARVAVVPGVAFGMDEHVRLSFATSMDQIEKGLDRIEALLRS
jgi:aspartate aminotransferase